MRTFILCLLFACCFETQLLAQKATDFAVIAYYTGDTQQIDQYRIDQLTHIIYSFCHLKEGKLHVAHAKDSLTIKHLVDLKRTHPKLKIMLSLGGWGGCASCSKVFSTKQGRAVFAKSVKEINDYFGTDGLDLDWEYPTIEGYPGHLYQAQDRQNFTALVRELRQVLGSNAEISFAAGGFQKYLDKSVDWRAVMPLVDRVNVMSYDLVNGYSTVTGHHTPLYSTKTDEESTNRAVQYLLGLGIPSRKLVIGAAFYTRVWKNVAASNNGLYQSGEHTNGYHFKSYATQLSANKGWQYFWDEHAQAPYWYNQEQKQFATGDDLASVKAKTDYAVHNQLGGIMFWELTLDATQDGMLQAIHDTIHSDTK